MRFSAVTALCAAPLALAGTLQQDLVARGAVGVEVARSESQGPNPKGQSQKSNDNSNKQNNNNNNNGGNSGGNNALLIQQSTVNEVVIIWVNNGGGAATSTVTDTVTVTQNGGGQANTAAAVGAQATHQVTVGGSAGLIYTPETIEAAVGDMVVFTFLSANHTVTQSAFTEPCVKLATGMDTGFVPNPNNTVTPPPQVAMQVTVATPLWFYCRQTAHCGKGMAFSINPTANKTQAMFKQMAIAQNGTGAASPITGGTAAAPPPPADTTAATPPPPAESAAAASSATATGSIVSGQGTLNSGGACDCSCLCGVASFPDSAIQGLGAFGGISGALPMAMLEK